MDHKILMGDSIANLPTDHTPPSHSEIEIVNTLFKKNQSIFEAIMFDVKDAIIVGILFAIFTSTQMDGMLKKFFPSMESAYMSIFIRAVAFMIMYYIIKNLHLVRK